MSTLSLPGRWVARLGAVLVPVAAVLALAAPPAATAQDDPPGRVGRIAEMHGTVWRYDDEDGRWSEAERHRPLTSGDRLSTDARARAELRVGSTVLRLDELSELEVLRLDDERLEFQLHGGALALRVRSREVASEIEIVTDEARLLPLRAGHYRIDRIDDTTFAGSWRGDLRVAETGFVVRGGQRVELYRDGRGPAPQRAESRLPDDEFAAWVIRDDQRDQRSASARYVSPEMTGAEDLDDHGNWDRHPEYGPIWYPYAVHADWAPYRYGRWVWVSPWGWTWIDDSPWGFAPFHYGRWVHWRGRWGWCPGTYVTRPVYAPALVAWVGGANWSVSVNIGGPAVAWVPLAPREIYVPYYRSSPRYRDRVNPGPRPAPGHRPPPRQVPTGPISYSNQGVPGGITVVPRDVLVRREPVARAVVRVPEVQRAPIGAAAPPARPDDDGRRGRGHGGAPAAGAAGSDAPGVRVVPPREHGAPARSIPPPPVTRAPAQGRDGEPRRRDDRAPRVERIERDDRIERPVRVVPIERAPGRETDEATGRDDRRDRGGRPERGDAEQREAPRPVRPLPAPSVAPVQPAPRIQPVQPAPQVRPVQPVPPVSSTRPVVPVAPPPATRDTPPLRDVEPANPAPAARSPSPQVQAPQGRPPRVQPAPRRERDEGSAATKRAPESPRRASDREREREAAR